MEEEININPKELNICLNVLRELAEHPDLIDENPVAKTLIAKVHRAGKRSSRNKLRQHSKNEDRNHQFQCGILQQQTKQRAIQDQAPREITLNYSQACYICKEKYNRLHFFYHQLCPKCADMNWEKRHQQTDLSSQTALITGGRIKIGYQLALKLLRDQARVIVTTRFPEDAALRFSTEPDFQQWDDRLQIVGLDLRNLPAVEQFSEDLKKQEPHLEILIHNAAQTIKRPLEFYRHLLRDQKLPSEAQKLLPAGKSNQNVLLEAKRATGLRLGEDQHYFPPGKLDRDGQQIDLRPQNSWRSKIGEIETVEMLEVYLVNAAAPFALTNHLRPLMENSPHQRKFIINVSAMEGQFARQSKTPHHPHTNMAKAALNMMTRTSAEELRQKGIFLNSVDTGWITDEKPYPAVEKMRDRHGFHPPLDAIDGASRIYDPIVTGLNQSELPLSGYFLKDYQPHPW